MNFPQSKFTGVFCCGFSPAQIHRGRNRPDSIEMVRTWLRFPNFNLYIEGQGTPWYPFNSGLKENKLKVNYECKEPNLKPLAECCMFATTNERIMVGQYTGQVLSLTDLTLNNISILNLQTARVSAYVLFLPEMFQKQSAYLLNAWYSCCTVK